MWRTIALTGLRRGELLGLRWQDIDFENNRLMVRQNLVLVGAMETAITKPKNHQSRVVDIDERTMDALRQQRKSVSEQQLAFGPGYHRSDLVFPRFDGRPMNPDTVSKRFGTLRDRLIRSSALTTRISLHGLRHTHASLLLADGIHVKVVSERLGHASTAFTMAVYQHTLPSMQREAAAAIAALVDGPGLAAVGSGI